MTKEKKPSPIQKPIKPLPSQPKKKIRGGYIGDSAPTSAAPIKDSLSGPPPPLIKKPQK